MLKHKMRTFGVNTIRYNNFLYTEDFMIYPVGSTLYKYCIEAGISEVVYQSDCILTYVGDLKDRIAVFNYEGQGSIIDKESYKVKLTILQEKTICLNSIDTFGDFLAVSYILDKDQTTVNRVYKVTDEVVEVASINGVDSSLRFDNQGRLFIIDQLGNDNDYRVVKMSVFDLSNYNLVAEEEFLIKGDILTVTKADDVLTVASNKRNMLVIDMKSAKLIRNISFEGKGCIGNYDLKDGDLYLTPERGILAKITLSELESDSVSTKLDQPGEQIIYKNYNLVRQLNSSLRVFGDKLYISNEIGLFVIDMSSEKLLFSALCESNSTFCGLSQNKEGTEIAYGDLEGKVTLKNLKTGEINLMSNAQGEYKNAPP